MMGVKTNNEGETPQQEASEPPESKAQEKAEVKAYQASLKKKKSEPKSYFDLKPGS